MDDYIIFRVNKKNYYFISTDKQKNYFIFLELILTRREIT